MATLDENILCKEVSFKNGEVDVSRSIDFILSEFKKSNKKEFIIVNIGTDRCSGDSYAPFLGSHLEQSGCKIPFYGTLEKPIHAQNLEKEMGQIMSNHENAFILSLDAGVTCNSNNVDKIIIKNKPIQPGKGLGKDLVNVGDMSIMYTPCEFSGVQFLALQNVRLGNVYKAVKETFKVIQELEYSIHNEFNIRKIS